ncbi:Nitrate reductase gamma subunit [Alkalidesulfovibrio alkalitolerans DSM 16529]|jgi:nitrate reductase gamma subunit|uniref:Nitrate reductase gamma subunit n=1 Tax=Alkalidesulfovibrio alkalitolerans DSM 16529 TaxID=1121439 RepID=S7T2E5_9BACT|nr:nitrate reductase subunit gamma [Alkalidesulfovibrio alkalitolerans]EPR30746.1 Nitrate reductase gamma subunit [Alkalidesulfovibrio alkalitolerans DSM 16529]
MYSFLTGPMLWIAFLVFFVGLGVRVVLYVRGLSWQLDRVAYGHFRGQGFLWALKSILFWLIPYKPKCWQKNPVFSAMFFLFHIGLVFVPIFLYAHVMLIERAWGVSWPTLPTAVADALVVMAIIAGVFLAIRRIALPEVRILTTPHDWFILILSLSVLATGFLSATQQTSGDGWLLAHVALAEALLIAAPFTKLSHIALFFCTRAQIGMDFGIKRGGMKGRGIVW